MIFWHVGGTILAFRYVFRDPDVDLRFLALGSVLPDLLDKPIGTIFFADTFASGQIFGHSLLFASLLMVIVLLMTRRGVRRKRMMALAVGVPNHPSYPANHACISGAMGRVLDAQVPGSNGVFEAMGKEDLLLRCAD